MYFSPKKHILSDVIMEVALVRLTGAGLYGFLRLLLRKGGILPDLTDASIWRMQLIFSAVTLLISAAIFLRALRSIAQGLKAIPREDRQEMARLQEEVFGEENAALPAETIRRLLRIWLTILVGAQSMYDFSSVIYQRFLSHLTQFFLDTTGGTGEAYVSLYNLTHGFKYQGMLIALLLGAMMTGIFLDDRSLKITSIVIALLFMISVAGLEMFTLSLLGRNYGIVWSSVIFHLMETVGLFALARYLRIRYHGV
ncbi:MAG: hypothetical protein II800_05405 [Lachnospiraceae bacterium]|nr:hypothetical protein [Lachnospiraceae bacterium]